MTTTMNSTDDLARDEILFIPLVLIDPDPDNPRAEVDAELAASIEEHGVRQAIEVRPHPVDEGRWMVVDGGRRFAGAVAAKCATVPARISLDVEDDGDRLVRQLVSNTGKPLPPVDEARAYKTILESKGWNQGQLAKALGKAKSTIGDRMALANLAAPWQELLTRGVIGASAAPILSKFRTYAEADQIRVAKCVNDLAISLKDNGRELEVSMLDGRLGSWYRDVEYSTSERAIDDVLDEAEERDALDHAHPKQLDDGPSSDQPPEVHQAHAIAVEIERLTDFSVQSAAGRRNSKRPRQLEGQLHAFSFWQLFRFPAEPSPADSLWRLMDFFTRWTRAGVKHSSDPEPHERALAQTFGVPYLTDPLWRNAPDWFKDARDAQSRHLFSLTTAVEWSIDVDAGQLLPAVWGSTAAAQRKKLKGDVREARKALIGAFIAFGSQAHLAEGDVDRHIAALRAKRGALVEATAAKQAEIRAERKRRVESLSKPTHAFTDTELLDGMERYDISIEGRDPDGSWVAITAEGESLGATMRDAIATAIETAFRARVATTTDLACKYCGCTERHACETDDGPCSWHDAAVPVCSNPSCLASWQEDIESGQDHPNDEDDEQPSLDDVYEVLIDEED